MLDDSIIERGGFLIKAILRCASGDTLEVSKKNELLPFDILFLSFVTLSWKRSRIDYRHSTISVESLGKTCT